MKKRKTIQADPLDGLVPKKGKSSAARKPAAEPAPAKVKKDRLTVHVTETLIDRVRNAVYWTPGLTLSALIETAGHDAVDALEKKQGGAFPPRRGQLQGGRPPK